MLFISVFILSIGTAGVLVIRFIMSMGLIKVENNFIFIELMTKIVKFECQ